MKITCPGCQWSAEVPDEKIPAGGVTATCRNCQVKFQVSREAVSRPQPDFFCPQCGTGQAVSDTCIHCHIIFAKYVEKKRIKELIPPVSDEPRIQTNYRSSKIAWAVIGLLLVAGLIYMPEIVSAGKLFFHIQPAHAKHIPKSAITVTRTNIASIFLKSGLQGATDDPVYKKLLEFGGRLYPRFDELLANPVKESGIDLAEDIYAFTERQEGDRRSRTGILFGIRDQKRFAKFLQTFRPGTASAEAGVSILKLDGGSYLYWNKSFALIYPGGANGRPKQRALAIMAMKKQESIVSDPLKKGWLEGRDDCLISVDLERVVNQPGVLALMKNYPYPQEVYRGSSLGFALNFVNGKATFDARISGAALLAEIRSISVPLAKEFLESIPADNYLVFLASHIPFESLQERFRLANPEQYRKADEMVERLTTANIEQLAASFTGDIGIILKDISRNSAENSTARQYPGLQSSRFFLGETTVEGSIAFGVKPDSIAVRLLHRKLQEGPEARNARFDGKIYRIDSGRGYYLLADNSYIAVSTSSDVVAGLAERKVTDSPAMPASLFARCSGALSMLELKLSQLFAALSDRQPDDTSLEQMKNNLSELRITSRLEKDQITTRGELLFSDETKNSLYQIAKLAVTMGEMKSKELERSEN